MSLNIFKKLKIKKFDEKVFYDKYVDKEAFLKCSYKKLDKFAGNYLTNLFFLPFLIVSFFSFSDLTNLAFPLFSV